MVKFNNADLVAFVKSTAAEDLSGKTAFVNVMDGELALYAIVPADKINETLETYYKTHYGPPVYMIDFSKKSRALSTITEFDWGRVREEE